MFAEEELIYDKGFELYYNNVIDIEVGLQYGWSIEPYMWLGVKDDEIVVWWEHKGEFKMWVFKSSEARKAEDLFDSLVKKAVRLVEEVEKCF